MRTAEGERKRTSRLWWRFGGSLNLHVHFHVLFVGLFNRERERPAVFHPATCSRAAAC